MLCITTVASDPKASDVTVREVVCDVPDEFPFPFEPYDIQKQLMTKVYQALQLGKIAILESPTGTVSGNI